MRHSIWEHKLLTGGLALGILAASTLGAAASTATISPTPSQTIKGWGSFPSYFRTDWSQTHEFDIFNKPAIQDALYNIGLTVIRVDLEPRLYVSGTTLSDIVLNTKAVDDLVNQLQIGRNHGVTKYIMSSWSPPGEWKEPEKIIEGKTKSGADEHLKPEFNGAYVAYYTKVIQTLNTRGVGLPAAISIQNEPDISPGYDGCNYNDRRSQWQDIVKLMRASFDANGLKSVEVQGPECTNFDNDHEFLGGNGFPDIAKDAALNKAIGSYASHGYGECWWTPMISGMAKHPKDAWVTEWCIYNDQFGAGETNLTMAAMQHFASNMVDLPFNYWCWWNQWSKGAPGGGSLVGGNQTPIYCERYWLFQKLWTTVHPGWIVHKMSCDDPDFTTSNSKDTKWPPATTCDTQVDLVAFESPDSKQTAVLIINKTDSAVSMAVNGLKGAAQTTFQSDSTRDLAIAGQEKIANGIATVNLAPKSVSIMVTQTGAPIPAAPTRVMAVAENGQVALQWSAAPGATSYNVLRRLRSGKAYAPLASGLTTATFTDTGVINGASYVYVVTATNASGTSRNSKQVVAATASKRGN